MTANIKHINTHLFGIICLSLLSFMPRVAFAQTAEINIETSHLSTLEDIFNLIKSKTDYEFVFRSDLIKSAPKVFLHKGIYRVDALLIKGLNKIECTYAFKNNTTIIVTKKSKQPKPQTAQTKTVSGLITFANQAIPNVNISIKNTKKGTKTNVNGAYTIDVEVGDVLMYSHVSFKTMAIIIEDVTTVLNLEMESQMNLLEETVVVAKRKKETPFSDANAYNKEVLTAAGKINPMLFPSKVHHFSGKQIGNQYLTLSEALSGKFSGSLPSIYDVDGVIYYDDSFIDISRIKDIYIVTGSAGTTRWGGPFIIISTMDAPEEVIKRQEAIAEQHRNQNYYQEDAKTDVAAHPQVSETVQTAASPAIKTISGNITQLDAPLAQVSIRLKYKKAGTTTDAQGNYQLKGEVGDVLEFQHYGYKTIAIVIEDITEVLDLEMVPKNNALDEVVVTAKTKGGKVLPRAKRAQQEFTTARGKFDPSRAGYSIDFISGEEITNIYNSLSEALLGKIPGAQLDPLTKRFIVKPVSSINNPQFPIWDVDGAIYEEEPPLDLGSIASVNVLKSVTATNRYGSAGVGGVIVVKTKAGDFNMANANLQKITHQYTNNIYYANDAISASIEEQYNNPYTKVLQTIGNKFTAFEHYTQNLKPKITDYVTHLDIAQSFSQFYKDNNLSAQILEQVMNDYDKNPEVLKAVAYQLQAIDDARNAVRAYKKVIQLRPKYAQSYRDLANAYKENDQFKKAWRVYMNYLMQGHDISGEGIGPLLFNEMEYLYYNRSHHTKIRERFEPKNETLLDFRNDVRLVFEWNTSEAEFDLEFVSPDKRAYVFEHTLVANQDLITDEKEKGYSSKDFIIENLMDGEWLVNITYRGNKKPEPSYLKVTQYFNWGKANQIQETAVYKFENLREKIQLIKLNKQQLLANN